jgi:SAM-dependent MidA family methyltransferase
VLAEPGERDITAHVNFSALEEHGARVGLEREKFETMASTLLTAGEEDQFAAAMAANPGQLKTLLFGMGETFRVLLQRKG